MKIYKDIFRSIISVENLFCAWDVFKKDKRNKPDVAKFERDIEAHIFQLHRDLRNKTYRHGSYKGFWIHDPKLRRIHKAIVRDRILHHALFRILNPIFEPTFIPTSFSCRIGKGAHRGMKKVAQMLSSVSKNNTTPCFALKCDVKKFFDSVDHATLLHLLEKRIKDKDAMWLLQEIVESYSSAFTREREREQELFRKGVPIGNLTSQLFANIYMNEFDQFVKHELKVKRYVRYTDDFIIVADNRKYLERILPSITDFLGRRLQLLLHPNKVFIRPHTQGIDFLGYVILPHHIVVRTKTRKRIWRKLKERVSQYKIGTIEKSMLSASLQSYLGVFSHANAHRLGEELKNQFWFWLQE